MNSLFKKIPKKVYLSFLLFIILIPVLFVVFNFSYFAAHIKYYSLKILNKQIFMKSELVVDENKTQQAEIKANFLEIPSLGIQSPVIYITETNEKAYQKALVDGVVHFPGSALPGQRGNVYIFGHSSDYAFSKGNYKTIFALLPHIEMGSQINISDSQAKVFSYRVVNKLVVEPTDLSVLKQDTNKQLLTLQTSYPIGTALRRYIVVAELIK